MIRLRISKRVLRIIAGGIGSLALIAGLYGLGTTVTVEDAQGQPLILSPSLRAAERYRRQAEKWVNAMDDIDAELMDLLSSSDNPGAASLYDQGHNMQHVGEQTAGLVSLIRSRQVPVALVGLRERALNAAKAYLTAAELTARWLNAPSEAGRQEALEALRTARALRVTLEESQWLNKRN